MLFLGFEDGKYVMIGGEKRLNNVHLTPADRNRMVSGRELSAEEVASVNDDQREAHLQYNYNQAIRKWGFNPEKGRLKSWQKPE